jgi:periplasmic protein TonB
MLLSILVAAAIATAPVTPPRVVKKTEPQFSEEARQTHEGGMVRLKVFIGADGGGQDVRIMQSAGYGLDEKAVHAIEQWEFRPAMKLGEPVEATTYIECNFAR